MSERRSHTRLIWNVSVIAIALSIAGYGPVSRAIRRYRERPTPYTGWLYTVSTPAPAGGVDTSAVHSYSTLLDLASARSLIGVAAYDASPLDLTIVTGGSARRVEARAVSVDYFLVMLIPIMLGRVLTTHDDEVGANPVVVVSREFWQRELGARPDAIGSTIELGTGPRTIVGVAVPPQESAELSAIDLWLPLGAHRTAIQGAGWDRTSNNRWLTIVARLTPGTDRAAAEAELTARLRASNGQTVLLRQIKPGKSPIRN